MVNKPLISLNKGLISGGAALGGGVSLTSHKQGSWSGVLPCFGSTSFPSNEQYTKTLGILLVYTM